MSYTNVWSLTTPTGSEAANTIKNILHSMKLDVQERMMDIFSISDFTADPLRPKGIKFTDGIRNWDILVSAGNINLFSEDNAGTLIVSQNVQIGPTLAFIAGDSLRVRANTVIDGTVEAMRVELHASVANTGTKYGLEAVGYVDHTTGTAQKIIGSTGTVNAQGIGGTTTDIIGVEANVISTGGIVTNATGLLILSPTASGGGSIANAIGISVGNVSSGSSTNFAIKTGLGLVQFGDQLILAASTTTRSGFRFIAGAAPTTPVIGDVWLQGTALKFYDGTTTRTFTVT